MIWTAGVPGSQWDTTLFKNGGPFTQSSHWAAVQAAKGRQVFYASDNGWQCMAILEVGKGASRIYAPYGPHITDERALKPALNALKRLAIRCHVPFVRCEPTGIVKSTHFSSMGLVAAARDVQPRYTWVKQLTQPHDELLAEMTSTNRNLYRTAANKGLTFRTSHDVRDLPIFLDMIHEVSRLTGMRPHSDKEFTTIAETLLPRNAAAIYIAEHQGKPVASALVYDSPIIRYYAHAASYSAARKLHPGSPLLSTMIFDAAKNGQQYFDFFGVAPPQSTGHKWEGFTKFKQSFGGEYKVFNGTWELPVSAFGYKKYRMLLKAHSLLRSR